MSASSSFFGMTSHSWAQCVIYFCTLAILIKPLGAFMAQVYMGERTFLSPLLQPVENLFYRLAGIHKDKDMPWQEYATAVILFSFSGFLLLFGILLLQDKLPLNPQALAFVCYLDAFG